MDSVVPGMNGDEPSGETGLDGEIGLMTTVARRVALAGGLQAHDADEVAQLAVVAFLESWTDRTKEWPAALLVSIVKRRVVDLRRAGRQRARLEHKVAEGGGRERDVGTGAAGEVDPTVQESLDRAIAGLSEKDRELLELRFIRGLTYRQAAAATGVPEPTLRTRLHRILNALRAQGIG